MCPIDIKELDSLMKKVWAPKMTTEAWIELVDEKDARIRSLMEELRTAHDEIMYTRRQNDNKNL